MGTAAGAVCPMHVALERVVATSSGNIVACWQLVSGGEPAALRRALAAGLPNAPKADVQAVRYALAPQALQGANALDLQDLKRPWDSR